MLIVDQFEELFTQNPPAVQARFAEVLGRLAREADVHVLLSMRDDFHYRCHEHKALAPVFADLTPIAQPSAESLALAVSKPAQRCGYSFEDEDLVDEMVREVAEERAALPLLAFTAARLWDERDRGERTITRAAYGNIGGVHGALARHAEATISAIGNNRLPMVREVFRNLATAQGTRATRDANELLSVFEDAEPARQVVNTLIDARLLTSHEVATDDGETHRAIEIVHESLLANWPRLVRWQTQDADAVQLRDQLRQAAKTWDEHQRAKDYLWTGKAYREFAVWWESYPGGLTEFEEAFAKAMVVNAQRRKRRRRMGIASAFAVLLAVLAVIGSFWRQSARDALRAEAQKLITLGQMELIDTPRHSIPYSLASLELADSEQARLLALEALWQGPPPLVIPRRMGGWGVDFSPDGRQLAVGFKGKQIAIWGSRGEDPEVLQPDHPPDDWVTWIRFAAEPGLLFSSTGMPGRGAQMWSVPDGTLLRSFDCGGRKTTGHLSEDGRRLITRTQSDDSSRMTLRAWPLPEGDPIELGELPLDGKPDIDPTGTWMAYPTNAELKMLPLQNLSSQYATPIARHDHRICSVAFDQQGNRVAAIDESGEIRLWSVTQTPARLLRTLQGPPNSQAAPLVFSPNGSMLALITGSLRLYDLERPKEASPVVLPIGASAEGITFDPQGRWIAATGMTRTHLWPLDQRYPSVMMGHEPKPMVVFFAPDSTWVASASWDGTVRLWPVSSTSGIKGRVLLSIKGREARFFSLATTPDGQSLIAGTAAGEVWLIPINGDSPQLVGRMNDYVQAAAVSRDNRTIATGGGFFNHAERVIRLWDLESGNQRTLDPGDEGSVTDLEFMGDGRLLSVSGGTLRRWNLEDGGSDVLMENGVRRFDLSADDSSVLVNFGGPWAGGPIRSLGLADDQWQDLPEFGDSVRSVAFNPTGTIAVAGTMSGTVRVGLIDGEEPHILFGPELADPWGVAVSPDGRWIAVGGSDGAVRLWPMPDLTQPPLHTLPLNELVAKLKTSTNYRVVRDPESSTGWTLTHDPFPGWETVPSW